MKITKQRLKEIIKEELSNVIQEGMLSGERHPFDKKPSTADQFSHLAAYTEHTRKLVDDLYDKVKAIEAILGDGGDQS